MPHICADEIAAIMALVPGTMLVWLWLRMKLHALGARLTGKPTAVPVPTCAEHHTHHYRDLLAERDMKRDES